MIWLMLWLSGCCTNQIEPKPRVDDIEQVVKNGGVLKAVPQKSLFPIADNSLPVAIPGVVSSQCDDLTDGGTAAGPDCATMQIQCGDSIIGHTKGGIDRYDSRFYEKNFCTPKITNHDGGDERVYQLKLPPGEWKAFVDLHTPCADLDLAAIKYSGDTCPTDGSIVKQCEMWPKDGTAHERVELVSQSTQGTTWWIVVEGKNNEEGAFSLAVQCREGLQ